MEPQLYSVSVTVYEIPFKSKAHAFQSHRLHQVLEDVVILDSVASATVQYSADRSDACIGTK